jgi:hypothetical protein
MTKPRNVPEKVASMLALHEREHEREPDIGIPELVTRFGISRSAIVKAIKAHDDRLADQRREYVASAAARHAGLP